MSADEQRQADGEAAAGTALERRPAPIELREWEKPWKGAFLLFLARQPNVSAACRVAGISRETAYHERREDPLFADAWLEARAVGIELLEQIAHQRATVGHDIKIVRRRVKTGPDGKVIEEDVTTEERVEVSDQLLVTLLKAYKPEMYRERYDVRHSPGDEPDVPPPTGPRVRSRERREELLRIAAEHSVHPDVDASAPAGRNGDEA
ncbi:MAG: hypothetical protein ACJ79H_17535 [Myxococcales bacterium]